MPDARSEDEVVSIFKLASDPTRLRVLLLLDESPAGAVCVTDLCAALGQTQPAVSHHLALLRVSGVVACHRAGKMNMYSLLDTGRLIVSAARAMMAGDPAAKARAKTRGR